MKIRQSAIVLTDEQRTTIEKAKGVTFRPSGSGFICNQTGARVSGPRGCKEYRRKIDALLNQSCANLTVQTTPVASSTQQKPLPNQQVLDEYPEVIWNEAGHSVYCPHCMQFNGAIYSKGRRICRICSKGFTAVSSLSVAPSENLKTARLDDDGDVFCPICENYHYQVGRGEFLCPRSGKKLMII